jgi:large subunit ribosomal protein L25
MNEVLIRCLPANLPEYIEVDMAALDVGDSVHLSQLTLPENVILVELSHGEDHDATVVTVLAPRGGAEGEDEDEDAAGPVAEVDDDDRSSDESDDDSED